MTIRADDPPLGTYSDVPASALESPPTPSRSGDPIRPHSLGDEPASRRQIQSELTRPTQSAQTDGARVHGKIPGTPPRCKCRRSRRKIRRKRVVPFPRGRGGVGEGNYRPGRDLTIKP